MVESIQEADRACAQRPYSLDTSLGEIARAGSVAQDTGTHLMDALSDVSREVRPKGGAFPCAELTLLHAW